MSLCYEVDSAGFLANHSKKGMILNPQPMQRVIRRAATLPKLSLPLPFWACSIELILILLVVATTDVEKSSFTRLYQ